MLERVRRGSGIRHLSSCYGRASRSSVDAAEIGLASIPAEATLSFVGFRIRGTHAKLGSYVKYAAQAGVLADAPWLGSHPPPPLSFPRYPSISWSPKALRRQSASRHNALSSRSSVAADSHTGVIRVSMQDRIAAFYGRYLMNPKMR